MADRDIEQAADLAAAVTLCRLCGGDGLGGGTDPLILPRICSRCEGSGFEPVTDPVEEARDLAAAEYVRITRGPLDGNAKGPLTWEDVAPAVWDDAENDDPLAADDLDELEVTD